MPDPILVVSRRVRKIADVISQFTATELAQLVTLIPQLQEVRPISELEQSLQTARWVQNQLLATSHRNPVLYELFLEGLTQEKYLALSTEAEITAWEQLFAEDVDCSKNGNSGNGNSDDRKSLNLSCPFSVIKNGEHQCVLQYQEES